MKCILKHWFSLFLGIVLICACPLWASNDLPDGCKQADKDACNDEDGDWDSESCTCDSCSSCTGSDGNSCSPSGINKPLTGADSLSIGFKLGLRAADAVDSLGSLHVKSDEPTSELLTPKTLKLTNEETSAEVFYASGAVSQLLAPQCFVQVENITQDVGYDIAFYYPSQISGSGPYTVAATEKPFAIWEVRAISGCALGEGVSFTKMILQLDNNLNWNLTVNRVLSFEWDAANRTWSYRNGNCLEKLYTADIMSDQSVSSLPAGSELAGIFEVENATSMASGFPYLQVNDDVTLSQFDFSIKHPFNDTHMPLYLSGYSATPSLTGPIVPVARKEIKEWYTITETVNDQGATVETQTLAKKEYRLYDLSITGDQEERLIMRIVNPTPAAGEERVCTYKTYWRTNDERNGKVKSGLDHTGKWTYYEYDAQGRTTLTQRNNLDNATWLDSGVPGTNLCRMVCRSYEPLSGQGDVASSDDLRPRVIDEYVGDQLIGRTWHVYTTFDSGTYAGAEQHIKERASSEIAEYGDAMNIKTLSIKMKDESFGDQRNLPLLEVNDDDTAQKYVYAYPAGKLTQTKTTGRYDWSSGEVLEVAGATKTVTTMNDFRSPAKVVTSVHTGTGWIAIRSVTKAYDDFNRLELTQNSDGTYSSVTWSPCCGKDNETLADGRLVFYDYDDNKRIQKKRIQTLIGYDDIEYVATSYTFDALGNALLTTLTHEDVQSDGSTTYEDYGSTTQGYDLAGRLTKRTQRDGIYTTYSYDGKVATTTRYDAADQIILMKKVTRYADGRIWKVEEGKVPNNLTTKQSYVYSVNEDGEKVTKVYQGDSSSLRWTETTRDFLGRVRETKKPGFNGFVIAETKYNSKGQQVEQRSVTSVLDDGDASNDSLANPAVQYEYNALGRRNKTTTDSNGNGSFGDSADQISETVVTYVSVAGVLYRDVESLVWMPDDTTEGTVVSKQRMRLNALGSSDGAPSELSGAKLVAETVRFLEPYTASAPARTSETWLDRASKTILTLTDEPTSTQEVSRKKVAGKLAVAINQYGTEPEYAYDPAGTQVAEKYAAGNRSGYTRTFWNDKGQLIVKVDLNGGYTWFVYNDAGQQMATVRLLNDTALPGSWASEITETMLSTYAVDDDFAVEAKQFDDHGRVIAQWGSTYPVAFQYNDDGLMTHMWTLYGAGNRPNLYASSDQRNAIKTLTNAETEWVYDAASGLLTDIIYADGNGPSYTYTIEGKLKRRNWARNAGDDTNPLYIATIYNYYAANEPNMGLLKEILYKRGATKGAAEATLTPDPDTSTVSYTYNRNGLQTQGKNDVAAYDYAYTEGQLDTETVTIGTVSYTIYRDAAARGVTADLYGRSEGYTLKDAAGAELQKVDYLYDGLGRLASVSGHGHTFTYKYLDEMNVNTGYYLGTKVNGHVDLLETTRTYETGRMFIDKVENTWDGSAISSFDYTNDAIGRRTHRIDSGSAFTNGVASNIFYYDDKSQVKGADMGVTKDVNDVVTHSLTSTYVYDELGNRTSASEDFVHATETDYSKSWSYTPTDLNQYSEIKIGTQSLSTPDYDDDGNMTLNPVEGGNDWSYSWNAENRLIKAVNADYELTFRYDHQGRRIRKVVKTISGTNEKDITFLYDGGNMIQEVDSLKSANQSSLYLWGLDLSGTLLGGGGVGGLLAILKDAQDYYPAYDANGNVSDYLDATGITVAHYGYNPFGVALDSYSDAVDLPFRFSTKYLDPEIRKSGDQTVSGIYYYGYRYYIPSLGCWLSRDPRGEGIKREKIVDRAESDHWQVGDGNQLYYPVTEKWVYTLSTLEANLRMFVQNSAISFVDPDGRFTFHGNWCGPDWTGGAVRASRQYDWANDPDPAVTSPLDECCRQHDACYAGWDLANGAPNGHAWTIEEQDACDDALCNCAGNVPNQSVDSNLIRCTFCDPDPPSNPSPDESRPGCCFINLAF